LTKLFSIAATAADTPAALKILDTEIQSINADIQFIYAFYGCDHDDSLIHSFLRIHFPAAAVIGGTSCHGIMTEKGLWDSRSIGLLLIADPDGDYGAASAPLGEDPATAAERALLAALANANCPGELPELIWIYQAPGHEEDIVEGLRRVVGDRCPIIGGSAADNSLAGHWRQLSTDGISTDGLVVGVLFPSGGIGYAFQGGYEPAGQSGIVTRIGFDRRGPSGIVTKSRGRVIAEIDGEPASHVYNRWVGNRLEHKLEAGGNVLMETTMCPLAIDAGQIENVSHYLLIHPAVVTPDGALSTFASIEEGTRIYSMQGDKARLIDRAGRVATEAISQLAEGPENIAGGLIVYCAGCMLAVGGQMPDVADKVAQSFEGRPFLGCFTFGEQGKILQSNLHGNLMISAIAFGQ
jgi:hypothetical protein